ncbi:MAG: riboflavin kinase [Lachnospiraceae bacterium]|nr:riboflavin kinase [Lachnospiraceae bacterium]
MIELPVTIKGTVLHGNKIGSEINMPTANLSVPKELESLSFGVYYSKVKVGDESYKSISNLGTKPTVKEEKTVNLETFIYDFNGDLYGKEIEVTLLKFKRPERKFSSIDELSEQMHIDLNEGRVFE